MIEEGFLTTDHPWLAIELGSGAKRCITAVDVTMRHRSARTVSMRHLDWEMVEYPVEVVEESGHSTQCFACTLLPVCEPHCSLLCLAKMVLGPRKTTRRGASRYYRYQCPEPLHPSPAPIGLAWPPTFLLAQHGWFFCVRPDLEHATRQQPLKFAHQDDCRLKEQSTDQRYGFYKPPHKNGEEANVGIPLAKTFIKYVVLVRLRRRHWI